jgi:hypothetical protein
MNSRPHLYSNKHCQLKVEIYGEFGERIITEHEKSKNTSTLYECMK